MGLQASCDKGPHPFLLAASLASHGRITISDIHKCLNECEIFVVYTQRRVRVRRGVCVGSCWRYRREGAQWGDLGVDGWIILGCISRRWDMGIWSGFGWPRLETGGGRL